MIQNSEKVGGISVGAWATLIGQIGFPIIVTAYLLTRFDGQMQQLIVACAK